MGVTGNNVQVQRFNGFAIVRLEIVKLIEDGNLGDVTEGCGVSLAHVDLNELTLWLA